MRLTERVPLETTRRAKALAAAHAEVDRLLEGFAPPLPRRPMPPGGTARALRKLVGRELGGEDLEAALAILAKRPSAKDCRDVRRIPERGARTLAAGAVLLAGVQGRLGVPLGRLRTGLREGAALELGRGSKAQAAASAA